MSASALTYAEWFGLSDTEAEALLADDELGNYPPDDVDWDFTPEPTSPACPACGSREARWTGDLGRLSWNCCRACGCQFHTTREEL